MRRHEDIGYDAFNSYRSGDENSSRNKYGSPAGNERGGSSVYGRSSRDTDSADHNYSTDPGYYGAGGSGRNQSYNQRPGYDENSRYSQTRGPENRMQNRGGQYGGYNSNYGNRNENWGNRNMNQHQDWEDRAQDRIEKWDDKINNAWNRWTGNDNNQVRQNWLNQPHNYSTFSHGNASDHRYSDNYGNPNSGYYNENRDYNNRNRHEDEGFFDNLGNKISNAWDRWVGNDDEAERRYQQRSHYPPSGHSSPRHDQDSDSYGSSWRRDNEW